MTGRAFVAMYHGMLVARHGADVIDAALDPPDPAREAALERATRHLAIVQMGGEVADAAG